MCNKVKVWDKLSSEFRLVSEEDCKELKFPVNEYNKAFKFAEDIIIFTIYEEEGEEIVEIYEQQMTHIDNKIINKNWKKVSPIKPLFHDWVNWEDEKIYISLFESYNISNKLSLQMFIKIDKETYIGITTSIQNEQDISIDSLVKNNNLIKKIIRSII